MTLGAVKGECRENSVCAEDSDQHFINTVLSILLAHSPCERDIIVLLLCIRSLRLEELQAPSPWIGGIGTQNQVSLTAKMVR